MPNSLYPRHHTHEVPLETGIRIQPLPIWEEEWEHPEKAIQAAASAKVLLDTGDANGACNRAYCHVRRGSRCSPTGGESEAGGREKLRNG